MLIWKPGNRVSVDSFAQFTVFHHLKFLLSPDLMTTNRLLKKYLLKKLADKGKRDSDNLLLDQEIRSLEDEANNESSLVSTASGTSQSLRNTLCKIYPQTDAYAILKFGPQFQETALALPETIYIGYCFDDPPIDGKSMMRIPYGSEGFYFNADRYEPGIASVKWLATLTWSGARKPNLFEDECTLETRLSKYLSLAQEIVNVVVDDQRVRQSAQMSPLRREHLPITMLPCVELLALPNEKEWFLKCDKWIEETAVFAFPHSDSRVSSFPGEEGKGCKDAWDAMVPWNESTDEKGNDQRDHSSGKIALDYRSATEEANGNLEDSADLRNDEPADRKLEDNGPAINDEKLLKIIQSLSESLLNEDENFEARSKSDVSVKVSRVCAFKEWIRDLRAHFVYAFTASFSYVINARLHVLLVQWKLYLRDKLREKLCEDLARKRGDEVQSAACRHFESPASTLSGDPTDEACPSGLDDHKDERLS